MYVSFQALVVLAQIIPILLLASYFDRDALRKIGTYSRAVKIYWFSIMMFILGGELLAITAIASTRPLDGWQGLVVYTAALFALVNLMSIAGWRVLGYDLVSGLPVIKRKKTKAKNNRKS